MAFSVLLLLLTCALLPEETLQSENCKCDDIVDCSNLGINKFDRSTLPCTRHHSMIDLSRNFLRTFPDDVHVFENVNISNNRLRELEAQIDQRLVVLDVSFNSLNKINLGDKFFSLQKLFAAGNIFSSSRNYVKGHCNLNFLDVTGSSVESLDSFTHCPALAVLLAPHNKVEDIPDQMGILKRLMKLDLSYNKLADVSRFPKSMEILYLSHNEIREITLSSFEGLHAVTTIDLKYNRIESIWENAFLGLNRLENIDFSHNLISAITDKAFNGLTSLHTVILNDNILVSIAERAFQNLPNLRVLQLGNNLLTEVPALRLEPNVTKVNMSLNDIRKVDDSAVVTILTEPARQRNLLLVANPIRGDDPGVQNLIFSFVAACSESLENSTRKLIEDWRSQYDFRQTTGYRDFGRLAYSQCPCAGISMENALLQICVSEAAEGWSGQHWLKMDDDLDDEFDDYINKDEL